MLALTITIKVVDLRIPAAPGWDASRPAIPLLVAYALAFINIGIFWTNHQHMLATASRMNGRALWANPFLPDRRFERWHRLQLSDVRSSASPRS